MSATTDLKRLPADSGEWRPLTYFKGQSPTKTPFFVSSEGRVASVRRKRVHELKGSLNTGGYRQVNLKLRGERWQPQVHELVVRTFPDRCGVPRPGHSIDHVDRTKHNNAVDNLRVKTHREQLLNRSFKPKARLTTIIENAVLRMKRAGKTETVIADELGISRQSVRNVVKRRR